MGGFRCKYIYFDIGFFELMKKWWLLKKKKRGEGGMLGEFYI